MSIRMEATDRDDLEAKQNGGMTALMFAARSNRAAEASPGGAPGALGVGQVHHRAALHRVPRTAMSVSFH